MTDDDTLDADDWASAGEAPDRENRTGDDEAFPTTDRRSFLEAGGGATPWSGALPETDAAVENGDADDANAVDSDADAKTTFVSEQTPDGSRLTSRPEGPAYHKRDGTTHLFTWDEPGPGARVVLYDEDESTDWGGGPDIHVYDTMERPDAEAGDVPRRLAPHGRWDGYKNLPELRPNSHSGDFSARIQDQNTIHKLRTSFEETTEVFLSYCVKIPDGKAMLGADEPGGFPESSVWKMAWLFNEGTRDGEDVDICLPSWTPILSIGGNNLDPDADITDPKRPDWWQWGEWMRFSLWLECGDDPVSDPGWIRFQAVIEGDETRVLTDTTDPIMSDGVAPYAWKRLNIPGWSSNKDVSGENVEALYDDIYVATGEDSNARVELSDDPIYENSTRMQLCKIRSWESNRVSVVLQTGSLDSVRDAAIHLRTTDEDTAVSMDVR